jgi:predicted dienelactone hydrolase
MADPLGYDPFLPGPHPVATRTLESFDPARHRLFPVEIWHPADPPPAPCPLVVFSHSSGAGRLQSTFLCTHFAGHGYVVAAMDHSEIVAPELARRDPESAAEKAGRIQAWISNRVPDIQFLIDYLLANPLPEHPLDPARIAIAGHSFGGWTALAAPDADRRIRAVVALAPGGAANPKPGILQLQLTFNWGRDVPTLYLVAEDDISLPLAGMYELFDRTPATKEMVVLRRADHLHFMDDVETRHEAVRAMTFPGELAWISKEMRPVSSLCSGAAAHLFIRGLALAHLDATFDRCNQARDLWKSGVDAALALRGISAFRARLTTSGPSSRETMIDCFQ